MISFFTSLFNEFLQTFHPLSTITIERKYHHLQNVPQQAIFASLGPGNPPRSEFYHYKCFTFIHYKWVRVWTHTASLTSIRLSICPSAVHSVDCFILSHYMPITACLPVLLLQTTELFLMFWLLGNRTIMNAFFNNVTGIG